jgi:hypothetical protein
MSSSQQSDARGWLGTETLRTRFGDFEFKDGYPVGDAPNGCSTLRSSIVPSRSTPHRVTERSLLED